MASAKIAITVPEEVLAAVDEAAREHGESRSGFISRILRAAIRARRDAEITRRLDALFVDLGVRDEQLQVAEKLDSVGTDWADESW